MKKIFKNQIPNAGIPANFVFVESGNAFLTRRVKEISEKEGKEVFVVLEARYGFVKPSGVFVEAEVERRAREEEERTRKEREEKRRKKEEREREKFAAEVKKQFPKIPEEDFLQIVARATAVGSGRVGRSGKLSLSEKVKFAVFAHVRHKHTNYDSLLSEARFQARDEYDDRDFAADAVSEERMAIRAKIREEVLKKMLEWGFQVA